MARLRCPAAALLLAAPAVSIAQQSGMSVTDAWSRAAIQGGNGVVYLTITDSGQADRLLSVTAPVAAKAELHESYVEQGVSKMRWVAALPITPGKPMTLSPGGYHIMLMGLKQPLKEGESFPLTLTFERAGQVTTDVMVRRAGGAMPTMPGMTH
jgi:copper(I)-binding protein